MSKHGGFYGTGSSDSDDISEPPTKRRRQNTHDPYENILESASHLKEIRTAWDNMCMEQHSTESQEPHGKDPRVFTCKIRKSFYSSSFFFNVFLIFILFFFKKHLGFPSGLTVIKKFCHNSTIQSLYDFVQVSTNMSLREFSIVTNLPRTVYDSYPKNTPLLGSGIPNFTVFIVCAH